MTPQEIFDKVATHLAKQGRRSMGSSTVHDYDDDGNVIGVKAFKSVEICRYRGDDNTSCAFGCLIPDLDYVERMEGQTAGQVISNFDSLKTFEEHKDLIRMLQIAHDSVSIGKAVGTCLTSPSMNVRLNYVAGFYKLDPAILDTLTFPEKWS